MKESATESVKRPGQFINIHLGQCGIQMGNSQWELLAAEHAVGPYGMKDQFNEPVNGNIDEDAMSSFFVKSSVNHIIPRAIMADLEPTVIDEIKNGAYRQFFHHDNLICGQEDTGSNFARGFFNKGKTIYIPLMNSIRKAFEDCDQISGVLLTKAMGGGTGSSVTSIALNMLDDYPKSNKFSFNICPSPLFVTGILEPYNCILAIPDDIEMMDLSVISTNESLYNIMSRKLGVSNPHFGHVNRLIAQAISNMTACSRFPNILYGDINSMMTNLVPFPRIHYPVCSMAPISNRQHCNYTYPSIIDLTSRCFDPSNFMINLDVTTGCFMSAFFLYRGFVSPDSIYSALKHIKNKEVIRFTDWTPCAFKVGICNEPPTAIMGKEYHPDELNLVLLSNHTEIGGTWSGIIKKFKMMYKKRAYLHWYVAEGMEEAEFKASADAAEAIVKDFKELNTSSEEFEKGFLERNQHTKRTTIRMQETAKRLSQKKVVSTKVNRKSPTIIDNENSNNNVFYKSQNHNDNNNVIENESISSYEPDFIDNNSGSITAVSTTVSTMS